MGVLGRNPKPGFRGRSVNWLRAKADRKIARFLLKLIDMDWLLSRNRWK